METKVKNTLTPKEPVTISLLQMGMSQNSGENLDKAIQFVRDAAKQGAEIVCLPELFRTPYFCIEEHQTTDYSEVLPGEVGKAFAAAAVENKIAIVGGSVYERTANGGFNTSVIYDMHGAYLGCYRKTHIPHDPGFFEQYYFTPAVGNYRVFQVQLRSRSVKMGVLICYDQWFPEAARSLALLGAEIIFYPTAIGDVEGIEQSEGDWHEAWKTVQRGHAIANGVIVAPVNRVGTEGVTTFWGGSFVCDAFGTVIAEGGNKEEIITATVDIAHGRHVRDSWRFFKERRPDTYDLITKSEHK